MTFRILVFSLVMSLAVAGTVIAIPAAVVNGVEIPFDRFVGALETVQAPNAQGQGQHPAGAEVLMRLISQELMFQLAEKEGVPVTEEQVAKRLEAARKDGSLDGAIKNQRMTLDEFKYELRVRQTFANLALKGVEVSDSEIKDYYFKNRAQFSQPVRVRIGAIVVKDKAKIDLAYDRVKKGEPFEKVVAELSEDDVTKASGGAIGWVWPNQTGVPPIIANTALGLTIGKASRPIKVEDKWVIVKAIERKLPSSQPLDEVKDGIREAIGMERGMKSPELAKKMQDLRNSANIDIKIDRFKDLGSAVKENMP